MPSVARYVPQMPQYQAISPAGSPARRHSLAIGLRSRHTDASQTCARIRSPRWHTWSWTERTIEKSSCLLHSCVLSCSHNATFFCRVVAHSPPRTSSTIVRACSSACASHDPGSVRHSARTCAHRCKTSKSSPQRSYNMRRKMLHSLRRTCRKRCARNSRCIVITHRCCQIYSTMSSGSRIVLTLTKIVSCRPRPHTHTR